MTDRLDRIERLQETFAANQVQIQANQQATQTRFDQFDDRMTATSAILADLAARQITSQNEMASRFEQFDDRMNAISATLADLGTRQITTQNQIDSLTALTIENNRAIAALGFRSVNHEGRLDDLEGQGEVE